MNCCRSVLVVLASGLVQTVMLAADTGTLRARIVDSEGAVMDGAHVSIRPDSVGRQRPGSAAVETVSADQMGRVTRDLEPGFFDVCVMADAFVPTCQKVRVVAGNTKNLTMKMTIDPNIIREIADTFPTRGR